MICNSMYGALLSKFNRMLSFSFDENTIEHDVTPQSDHAERYVWSILAGAFATRTSHQMTFIAVLCCWIGDK